MPGGNIGFSIYAIPLLLATGVLLLRLDVKKYEFMGMHKERKAAFFLGWCNVILGLLFLIGNWVRQNWPF
jgi:hypothetical protein